MHLISPIAISRTFIPYNFRNIRRMVCEIQGIDVLVSPMSKCKGDSLAKRLRPVESMTIR